MSKISRRAAYSLPVWLLLGSLSFGQDVSSVWDGVYSADQAARGRATFAERCAACHGENGVSLRRFDNSSVGAAFEFISTNMPPGQTLPPDEYADILAFLLENHDFPAGDAELVPDLSVLSQIALNFAADAEVKLPAEDAGVNLDFAPVTNEMLANSAPENWLTFRNGYNGWGYSALDKVNTETVDDLRLAWSRGMEVGPLQIEPIVYNGIMFLLNSTDVVQALDATNGDLLWEYRRALPADIGSSTGAILRARGVAIHGDKLFLSTQDGYMIALDAHSGKLVWETFRADFREKFAATAAPVVVGDKVLVGSLCSPSSTLPGGCFISAFDMETGEEVWRRHTIARPDEVGGDTWGDLPLESRFHGSPWMTGTYDAELNLTYWGTGVPSPMPAPLRGTGEAELLYTNSTLALNPDTGEIVWYYQHLPGDHWDLDHPFERIIVETALSPDPAEVPWISPNITQGEVRKVITGIPGKTGIIYTLDAATGEFLWARPTTAQNIISDIDPTTGIPTINLDVSPVSTTETKYACPSLFGGKDQPSGAYSPDHNAMFMPLNNICMDVAMSIEEASGPQDGYALAYTLTPSSKDSPANIGRIEATDAATGKTLWTYEQRAIIYGSLLTTGGDLLFSGDANRRFRAHNIESGAIEWETILNGNVTGRPMTYEVNGRQYVAIGAGGVSHASYMNSVTPELPVKIGSNTLFVFALPEE